MKQVLAVVLLVALALAGCSSAPQASDHPATPTPNSAAQSALGAGGTDPGYTAALLPDWIVSKDGGWVIDTASLFEGMTSVQLTNDLTGQQKVLDGDAAAQAAQAMGEVRLTSFRGRVVEPKAGYEWGIRDQKGNRGIRFDSNAITISLSRDEYEFLADQGTLRSASERLQGIYDAAASAQ